MNLRKSVPTMSAGSQSCSTTSKPMLLDAAKAEGERPSTENLPSDGSLIARNRVDDMGAKTTEFFGRESFVKSMGLPGRRVLRICNPKTGDVLHGPPFPQNPRNALFR